MPPSSLLTRKKKTRQKRKAQQPPSIEVAALYSQDLGSAGIKKKRRTEQAIPLGAIALPMTKEEKKKRKKRKVRTPRCQYLSRFVFVVANPALSHFDSVFAMLM
jgi:hypothetical protein